jgi:hypothetical protein
MPTDRKTVATPHGEVEYETVVCDSCGSETRKDDAYRFLLISELKRERSFSTYAEFRINKSEYADGWACPYCADAEPIDYPGRGYFQRVRSELGSDALVALAIVLSVLCVLIVVFLMTLVAAAI